MITIQLFKKKIFNQEIEDFMLARRSFITTPAYRFYLEDFFRITGVTSADDITEDDIEAYATSLRFIRGSEYQKRQAITAINLFKSFRNRVILENVMQKKIGRPRSEKIRIELNQKKKEGWTIRKMAKFYDRAPSTIHQLLNS